MQIFVNSAVSLNSPVYYAPPCRCGVVGITRLNLIWVEIFGAIRLRPVWVRVSMIDYASDS